LEGLSERRKRGKFQHNGRGGVRALGVKKEDAGKEKFKHPDFSHIAVPPKPQVAGRLFWGGSDKGGKKAKGQGGGAEIPIYSMREVKRVSYNKVSKKDVK